jgi:hypothetical protein
MGSDQVAPEMSESQPISASSLDGDRDAGNLNGGGGDDEANPNKQPVRKRTKTGCLSECPLPICCP